MSEIDLYKEEDRKKAGELNCPFCGHKGLIFSHSYGYGSHFADSSFSCPECRMEYSVSNLLRLDTLEEIEEELRLIAKKHYDSILREKIETQAKLENLKELIKTWKRGKEIVNPSKR